MGSFSLADWRAVEVAAVGALVGLAPAFLMSWRLDMLSLGEEEAIGLGVNVARLRLILVVGTTLAAAAAVLVCGVIGWVGLVVPNLVRRVSGPDHRTLLPLSTAAGAAAMIVADTLARSAASFEIPIGAISALAGVPLLPHHAQPAKRVGAMIPGRKGRPSPQGRRQAGPQRHRLSRRGRRNRDAARPQRVRQDHSAQMRQRSLASVERANPSRWAQRLGVDGARTRLARGGRAAKVLHAVWLQRRKPGADGARAAYRIVRIAERQRPRPRSRGDGFRRRRRACRPGRHARFRRRTATGVAGARAGAGMADSAA